MNLTIHYTIKNYDEEDDKHRVDALGVNGHSYTPNLTDARAWDAAQDQYIFVEDLLGLSACDDGDTYVTGKVNRVESAFLRLL
jgi:hypothetical protein